MVLTSCNPLTYMGGDSVWEDDDDLPLLDTFSFAPVHMNPKTKKKKKNLSPLRKSNRIKVRK